jgi:hypothetical protein
MSGEPEAFVVRQEEDAIAGGRLLKIALFAIGVGLIGVLFSALLLETNTGGIRGNEAAGGTPRAAGSTIANIEQTSLYGVAGGLELRRAQREQLSRYRWVDRDGGVAAIPIERAMDIIAGESR